MSSSINPNSINNQYPVAGQDNNSQGFRDNFGAIKNNFDHAKNEISDLQNKAILKAPLAGETTTTNVMTGVTLSGAILKDLRESTVNLGTVTAATSISVVYSDADFQRITLGGAGAIASSLVFSGFPTPPPSNQYTKLTLEITVTNILHTLTLPLSGVLNNLDGLGTFDSLSKTFEWDVTGVFLFEFGTYDAGSTLLVREITRRNYIDTAVISGISTAETLVVDDLSISALGSLTVSSPVPATSVGAAGDEAKMIAADSSYLYVCTGTYDGISNIWKRVSLTGGAW